MLMADTLAIFLVVIGFLIALPALWLLCRGLWPQAVTNTTDDCARGLLKPFLVGIPISLMAFFAATAASNAFGSVGGLITVSIICLFVFYASVGIAGLTTAIGQRLPSPADADRPWQATIRGSVVLELAFLLPILGWFIILPAALIIGSGSALRSSVFSFKNRKSNARPLENPDLGVSAGAA
mgnify:CR=1 FL=1